MNKFLKAAIWGLIILAILFCPVILIVGGAIASILVYILAGLAVILLPVIIGVIIGYVVKRN